MSAIQRPLTRPQLAELKAARMAELVAELDAMTEGDPPPHLLAVLEQAAPPLRQRTTNRAGLLSPPWWRPNLPDVVALVDIPRTYAWGRRYQGLVYRLDRNAAYLSAASTVHVAHGDLYHAGGGDPLTLTDVDGRPVTRRVPSPGLYRVRVWEWHEGGRLPSPLGRARVGADIWVTAARVGLLIELAEADRWPDVTVSDSWIGDGHARLDEWTRMVNLLRGRALDQGGPKGYRYQAVKDGIGQAIQLMGGSHDAKSGDVVYKSATHRPDWMRAIQDHASVTLWRAADRCAAMLPHLPPVSLRATDELVIAADALGVVTQRAIAGGTRPPVRLDQTGRQLGTFKVQDQETGPVDWPMPARKATP